MICSCFVLNLRLYPRPRKTLKTSRFGDLTDLPKQMKTPQPFFQSSWVWFFPQKSTPILIHFKLKNGDTAPSAGLRVVDERTKGHLYVGITNLTELPLVYVLYQSVPEFWGVLQPGQRAFRYLHWFNAYNLVCYPFTGNNEPTIHTHPPYRLAPNYVSLIAAASSYAFSHGASAATAGTALAAVASIVKSPITYGLAAESTVAPTMLNNPTFLAAFNRATALVHSGDPFKANGQCFHIVGGIQKDQAFGGWREMQMTWQT